MAKIVVLMFDFVTGSQEILPSFMDYFIVDKLSSFILDLVIKKPSRSCLLCAFLVLELLSFRS